MQTLTPGRSLAHAFGAELRRLRIEKGLSQAGLGELVHHSGATVGRIEKAERLPTVAFCQHADTALDTGGILERMCPDRGHDGELRRHILQHQRATRLVDALETAGLTLDSTDREQADRFAATAGQWFESVIGWLARAGDHGPPASPCPDTGDGGSDQVVVTGPATSVTHVTVHVFTTQQAGGPSQVP